MKRTMVWPIRVFFILITRSNRMSHNLRNKRLSHELCSSLQCPCLDSGARGCSSILISISGILIEQRVCIEANETTDLAIAALESCESTGETKNRNLN